MQITELTFKIWIVYSRHWKAIQGYIFGWITKHLPWLFMEFQKPKTSWKTSCFFLNDAMFCRCFWKNIDVDVFDDVLQKAKHRANDASNDVNRPPLLQSPESLYLLQCSSWIGIMAIIHPWSIVDTHVNMMKIMANLCRAQRLSTCSKAVELLQPGL